MPPHGLDPSEEELSPYSLTKTEFRHLQAAGRRARPANDDGFDPEVWNRLDERGLVYPALDGWRITRQGETYLHSITLAYGP